MKANDIKSTQNLPANPARSAEILPSGRLNTHSSRLLIDHLHAHQFSGRLTLAYREKRKKIWFFQGEVFRIQSNLAPELFGQMMIERNWMNESDLKKCLEIQRQSKTSKSLGELVQEIYGIGKNETDLLHTEQMARGLFQALTWDDGEYEIAEMDLRPAERNSFSYEEFIYSVRALVETSQKNLGPLFKFVRPWKPKAGGVNLAEFPVWAILAGCRLEGSGGILSIRKQNKLHEIVIKHGVPLTLYEGTFGQPRQTLVVRQASDEHEKFFIEQLFKLFSFLTGSAHFRPLGSESSQEDSHAQGKEVGFDHTKVLSESSSMGMAVELTAQFLAKRKKTFNGFLQRILLALKRKLLRQRNSL